jgi:hypothetical protein
MLAVGWEILMLWRFVMRKILVLCCLLSFLMLIVGAVMAEGDQAYFAILAETKVQKMPGMKMPKLPPGMDLSKIPGMKDNPMLDMMRGEPTRTLEVRLWSPGIAPENAFATVAPPEGLKQGKKLDLNLYRPKKEEVSGDTGIGDMKPEQMKEFIIKIYWGSSATVREGQPKIIKWGGLTPEQKVVMKRQAAEARKGGSYFYKPDWTTGYWPTDKQPGKIAKDASMVGDYALTTNYTGNVAITAPENVNFLAPIDLTSPSMDDPINLDGAVAMEWKQIPYALGIHGSAFGMEGKNTLIIWNSSEVFTEGLMGDMGFLQMAEVAKFVKDTVFMKGTATKCTIPAGIFSKCQMAMLTMTGYGPGTALEKVQPIPRIQTKTSLSMMMGMKGMGGMPPMQDDEEMGEEE